MAGRVGFLEVEADDSRLLVGGQIQPAGEFVEPLFKGNGVVVVFPEGGIDSLDRGLGSDPERGGAGTPLLDRGDPDRLAAPPLALVHGGGPVVVKDTLGHGIEHLIVDDPVVRRIKAGHDRVMVRKRIGGIDGNQRAGGAAFAHELPQVRGLFGIFGEIVPTEGIHRDEDERGGRFGPGRGRAAVEQDRHQEDGEKTEGRFHQRKVTTVAPQEPVNSSPRR